MKFYLKKDGPQLDDPIDINSLIIHTILFLPKFRFPCPIHEWIMASNATWTIWAHPSFTSVASSIKSLKLILSCKLLAHSITTSRMDNVNWAFCQSFLCWCHKLGSRARKNVVDWWWRYYLWSASVHRYRSACRKEGANQPTKKPTFVHNYVCITFWTYTYNK